MKKQLLLLIMLCAATLHAPAQTDVLPPADVIAQPATVAPIRFGYISYQKAFESMSGYAAVRADLDTLRAKYDKEMKRVEDEFNKKYEAFLEGQRDFAPSILQKRQAELQELMEKNMAFKQEARRLMKQAEQEAYRPLRTQLNAAIGKVAQTHGLAFVINADANVLPFVDPTHGTDITALVTANVK